jgi:hypothetical protein
MRLVFRFVLLHDERAIVQNIVWQNPHAIDALATVVLDVLAFLVLMHWSAGAAREIAMTGGLHGLASLLPKIFDQVKV